MAGTQVHETAEGQRLAAAREFENALDAAAEGAVGADWRLWGTYLSDRQWGTVREDYSEGGTAWDYLPHDHARSRAYRWGEDGLAGFCDRQQRVCFGLALWNGVDPILKERFFGLTNGEGNHGEDIKEYHFHLDNTPTHSHATWLYKYPQRAFPYSDLVAENGRRKADPRSFEYELLDTGVFDGDRYFDVEARYAKVGPADIVILVTVTNRGPDPATLHVLPTLWFRNTWTWYLKSTKPGLRARPAPGPGVSVVETDAVDGVGAMRLYCESPDELLFTENETNNRRLFGGDNASPFIKDAFHDYLIGGHRGAVNTAREGTKAAAHYRLELGPGASATIRLRLADAELADPFGPDFDATLEARRAEADAFYDAINTAPLAPDRQAIQRQAYAGMLWCKQLYYYVVTEWLDGDKTAPPPPSRRRGGRNHRWRHYYSEEVLSMPDSWEYPWFASWDMAFHTIVLATIDPDFAKRQLVILAREWQMNPDGQIPAYEWSFDDVNPPLHAWAAWRIYKIEAKRTNNPDRAFLKAIFERCLLYATWWFNRKDPAGRNLFMGGFLGMDNIGPFDRDHIPGGYELLQADGTGWMGMFSLTMMKIALELGIEEPDYYSLAMKFFQNFVFIGDALNNYVEVEGNVGLWNEIDGFFYDAMRSTTADEPMQPIKVRSFAGLVPLFAIEAFDHAEIDRAMASSREFATRFRWFIGRHPELVGQVAKTVQAEAGDPARLLFEADTRRVGLALADEGRLRRILERVLDEGEFLGPHGIRSVSKAHAGPGAYHTRFGGVDYTLEYAPAESTTQSFGGNSNWRGPVWFPVNYLLIESLQKYHRWLGNDFRVECPTGSGTMMNLWEVAAEISRRLVSIFERGTDGRRPVFGGTAVFQSDPQWKDRLLFFEYFQGDNGAGLGASHQTGWTGLTAKLIQQLAEYPSAPPVEAD